MHKTIRSFALLALIPMFTASLSAQQNYFSVKFPDDRTIFSCGGTADTSDWPQVTYYTHCSFNVGISVKDQVFNLNNTGGCKKILRTWKLVYWCDYNPNWPGPTLIDNPGNTDIGPTVWGNSINHGYLQYTQIIKIVDNVAPVFLDCPTAPLLFCDYTNNDPAQYGSRCEGPIDLNVKVTDACSKSDLILSYRLYLDLDGNGSMETYRSSSAPGAWPIEKTITGDTVFAQIKVPAGVGLPYGIHKVEWIANDRCGNESLCKYEFEVRDCKPPTVVCINGLSINMMPGGMITLWDSDFVLYTEDNCTPTPQIKTGIRKAGTGTGFPNGSHSVTFDCNEVGKQFVEIWAEDAYGNADFCLTYVIVKDNIGTCTPSGPVSGNIATDQNEALKGAKVLLKSNLTAVQNQAAMSTDAQGNFAFAQAPGTCNYSITPSLDTLPKLGVNTLDIVLTELHILGQTPLPTPYRIIAADVTRDGQLDTADLDAMSDLILGVTDQFPGNTSWRFVPSAFVFPNPAQPLATVFPEKISTVCPAPNGQNQHFTAIKTGDVDLSANLSSKSGEENQVEFHTPRQRFMAGDAVVVPISISNLGDLTAFQFSLEANPEVLSLQSVEPGTLAPRLGISLPENRVAASWYALDPVEGEQTVVVLNFLALQNGSLGNALSMNASVAQPEAYTRDFETRTAVLRYLIPSDRSELSTTDVAERAELFPIAPNPTSGPVVASFYLPTAGPVTLRLSDLNGRIVLTHSANFDQGYHRVSMPVEISGVYSLSFQSANGTGVGRVVVLR